MASYLAAWTSNWLRFLTPKAKAPPKPERMSEGWRDYTFSTLSAVSGGLTPDVLQGILSQAADGYCDTQALLIQEIQEKEPVIAAHVATRKGAVTGSPWTVTSEADPERAAEIEKALRDAGLSEAVAYLADYIMTGYSAVVVDWSPGGKAVNGFVPIAPESFEFDSGGNAALKDKLGAYKSLSEFHPAQFLTLFSQAKPGIPCRNGLGRALLWMYLFKHQGLAGYARYIERYGIPFLVATLPQNQWTERNAVLSTLKAMGRDGVSVKREGTGLELMQGAAGGSTQAQESFIRYCDEVFALAILGQIATSGDAGGLSKGQAQENVRMDLLASDCTAIMSAVQRGLLVPLCQMAYGMPDAGDIVFDIEYQPADDLDALAARWKIVTEITGKYIDPATAEEQFGVKLAGDKAPPQPFGGQPPPDGTDAPAPSPAPAAEAEDEEDETEEDQQALVDTRPTAALDAVVQDALKQIEADPEALAAWTWPVQEAIRTAFGDLAPDDVEGFKARLPAFMADLPKLLGRMDSKGFEEALAGAMLASVVNGYTAEP